MSHNQAADAVPILEQLHFELYGEHQAYYVSDIMPHVQKVQQILSDTFAFKALSETYGLSDLSVGQEHLDQSDLMSKYIYLYIFLDILYDKVRQDPAEKAKLYDRINYVGTDNSVFGYVKLYTVYYATKITTYFNHWLPLRFCSTSLLCLNIMEAVLTDLFKGHFDNAATGLFLCLSAPFSVGKFRKDEYDNVLCKFSDDWLDLYTSWNTLFTYADGAGQNYFPRTSVCLLNSLAYKKSEWLNSRAYVLFASHILKSSHAFNNLFGLDDVPNQLLISDWNKLNHRQITQQIRTIFE